MRFFSRKSKKSFFVFFIIFMLAIFFRLFVFEIYYVTSSSMEDTLQKGDIIIIEKLSYGARIPSSFVEIPWLKIIPYMLMDRTSISNQKSLIPNSKRIKGLSTIKRNDVLVFNDPSDYTKYMIKRCVAMPKDSLVIKKSIVYINNKEMVDARYVKKEHEIKYLGTSYPFPELMRDLGIRYRESWIERKNILKKVSLTVEKKTKLLEIIDSDQVSEVHEYSDPELVIYKKFKTTDFPKYSKVFNKYENCTFNSTSESELIFNNDYYFVLGDNRNSSFDSRSYGVIPKNLIVGKAVFILFSIQSNGKLQKERFLKKIS